jgi:hypothetical protein
MKDPERLMLRLRLQDETARERVANCVRDNGGNLENSAAALGIARASLYRVMKRDPKLAAMVAEHAQGREGSRIAAVQSRRETAAAKAKARAKKKKRKSG